MQDDYAEFLDGRAQTGERNGFSPIWMPGRLKDFQVSMTEWAIWKGRAALFEDCGLGKTFQQLVWAENVVRNTNRPVLLFTPLAVAFQLLLDARTGCCVALVCDTGL